MRSPFSPLYFTLFAGLLGGLLLLIQLELFTIAFERLGLSQESAFVLLIGSLIGSVVNLPLATVAAENPPEDELPPPLQRLLRQTRRPFEGRTLIALNVGGGLIPICFSAYLLSHNPLPAGEMLLAVALVSAISYGGSRPLPGIGVGMPIFIGPVAAAVVAMVVDPAHGPLLAYVGGTLGVLIGADLLRLKDVRKMGAPVASIGGAGTFDGIFVTGVIAVLLASVGTTWQA